ncbi:MAG: hypothetical protein JNK79_05285 [Chitinophagaceae bacterium]|nr:hypothetical protein [Chitinophagaceae bacterium]
MSILISDYIERFSLTLPGYMNKMPWEITENLTNIIEQLLSGSADPSHGTSPRFGMTEGAFGMTEGYTIEKGVAIHESAVIEQNVVLKPPLLIGPNVTIGANAYLRGPVLLDAKVHIGAGCEIKQSVIFMGTAVAHFNYIGNSIIGGDVNFEAGSVAANHYNERDDKIISVKVGGKITNTGIVKFGSLVGDRSRIGANAVLSPGTVLGKGSVVARLELVQQT